MGVVPAQDPARTRKSHNEDRWVEYSYSQAYERQWTQT
jgi:hypothetical protein